MLGEESIAVVKTIEPTDEVQTASHCTSLRSALKRFALRYSWWRTACEGAWSIFAGLIGSLCCIGPSAAILLGLGSSSVLFNMHIDQRLALGGGVLMLLGGCALAIWRTRTCNLPQKPWRRVLLMLTSGVLAYALLGVLVPWVAVQQEDAITRTVAAKQSQPVSNTAATHLRQATLLVEKMDCPPCVTHLSSLLARKPFVQRFEAHGGNEQVVIVYDSTQIDTASLIALIPPIYRAMLSNDLVLGSEHSDS
ncbi:MAG: hypothetical protein SH847_19070 [Roseiflexaceae bacterium]|nr:hypothetical protein [Roseiflexaceae bacterium]